MPSDNETQSCDNVTCIFLMQPHPSYHMMGVAALKIYDHNYIKEVFGLYIHITSYTVAIWCACDLSLDQQ